jgi:hypothetical protein
MAGKLPRAAPTTERGARNGTSYVFLVRAVGLRAAADFKCPRQRATVSITATDGGLMRHVRLCLALLTALVAPGCAKPVAPAAAAADRPTIRRDTITIIGVLRAPGTSTAPGAPAGEWVVELPKGTDGKVATAPVDVSAVTERAAALAGQKVRATFRTPTQADAHLTAMKLTALEAR